MDVSRQTQDQLAVSASMRTALLVYSGITVKMMLDSERHRLTAGDIGFAGVGCVHGFANPAKVPVRWLETQAPQPPARHSYRFARDWDYLREHSRTKP